MLLTEAEGGRSSERVVSSRHERIFVIVSLQRIKRAPLLPMSGGFAANKSTRAVNAATHTAVSDFLPYFNFFLFMCAVLCSTDTRNLNPSNPGFFPHTNPGLKIVWFTRVFGYPGSPGCIPYLVHTHFYLKTFAITINCSDKNVFAPVYIDITADTSHSSTPRLISLSLL